MLKCVTGMINLVFISFFAVDAFNSFCSLVVNLFLLCLFGKKGVKGSSLKDFKETSPESVECSAPVRSNYDDHEAPLPRVVSVSKPTPKPRPRSLVVEMDSNKEDKVPVTAERPVAPPRSKSKSSKTDIEAGSQKDHSAKAAKLDFPNRMEINLPLPLKPKPRPGCNEIHGEQRVSPSFSGKQSAAVADASIEDITASAGDIQTGQKEIKGSSEVEPWKDKANKPRPPPIPRRIDLD